MSDLIDLKIAIFSQDDNLTIPKNIMKLNDLARVEIVSIFSINVKGSLSNKKMLFIKGFGIFQVLKMGLLIIWEKLLNKLDQLFGFSIFKKPRSLFAAAHQCGSNYKVINNPNDDDVLSDLISSNINLIVSFSAPCLFKKELLDLPLYGCINLHCSLLPKYAGILPSFWTLYRGEKIIGATVHYMDCKLDHGKILGQVKIPMPKKPSMLHVIRATKDSGGNLVCKVIKKLISGSLVPKLNSESEGNYYSWPSLKQIREFQKNGGRLI